MKRCSGCKVEKTEDQFNKSATRKDGLQPYCRECNKHRAKHYYANNREAHIKNIVDRKRQTIKENQDRLIQYLSEHPCVDCGESDVIVLDLDHVRGEKRDHVTHMLGQGVSWRILETEIAKCEVRCANCHRRKSAAQLGHYRFKHTFRDRLSGKDTRF